MQYEITLPADYDMGIIRDRVATKGHLLDAFPGLALKAYLVREREAGSPVNAYAPFYLWRTAEGMNSFLWGAGFRGLSADFGRPVVRHWVGAGFDRGPAHDGTPTAATRVVDTLAPDADPAEALDRALARAAEHTPDVHSVAVAVDPSRWELVRFTLYAGEAPDEGVRYRVAHLSRPELADLATGRHW
ncbi:DUF4865 family protein [Saccharothrix violaceirubra]|uniref:DUF4865 domain-containing protein n=1 Tax=Saccharothrix violaceirubra TaxID=413306 RepID=A0A7W7WVL1_9PSEU|nr:DUF4865 family protein [Saccharothrix violaceirubra]MBB4965012.1 hypothetical protein [Saccharothrix violaceirubra]